MEYENLRDAIDLVSNAEFACCHFITPNDVGATGGHQCGFSVGKQLAEIFFDKPGVKGSNLEKEVEIRWQKELCTHSLAKYYGVRTRNEYRLTRFGRGFEYLQDEYIGSLLVLTRSDCGEYNAYVLKNQDNIENFLLSFNLDLTLGNQVIERRESSQSFEELARQFVSQQTCFPDTEVMSGMARDFAGRLYHLTHAAIISDVDAALLKWVSTEYDLFRALEERIYYPVFSAPFQDCQALIDFSNMILNRRKSRAGKSLEHHLSFAFSSFGLRFEEQVITENHKRPDFVFPDGESYHNLLFPAEKLTVLGAKTTCKDRWRQVLNEADRVDEKYLFTLQQGVSSRQLQEMKDARLTLVVPRANFVCFVPTFHDGIMCLRDFIEMVRERQG